MHGEDDARFEDLEAYEGQELPMPDPPDEVILPMTAWGWMGPFFGTMRGLPAGPEPVDAELEMERQLAEAEEYLSLN